MWNLSLPPAPAAIRNAVMLGRISLVGAVMDACHLVIAEPDTAPAARRFTRAGHSDPATCILITKMPGLHSTSMMYITTII